MNIVVNDLLTHYQLTGKGKLVLLLHGWGDSAKGLTELQTELAKRYQVLSIDLPGFGSTEPPKEVWNLDNYAHFLKKALSKLILPHLYAIIGHSNGGALAIRAISMGELQPQRLVLLAASGVRTNNQLRRSALKMVAKTGNVATILLPERHRRSLRKKLYGAAGSDLLVVPGLQATFKKTVRQDMQADAAAIKVPTLLIYASDDDAIPVADGTRYHQLVKGSRLEVVEQAGHFVHLDQPERVLKLIGEFLT